jgi:hypothetical protein
MTLKWCPFLVGMFLCAGCWVKDSEIRKKIEALDKAEETGDTGEEGAS